MTASIAMGLDAVEPASSVVCIGFFDGVHRGHRALLHRTQREAADEGVRSVVATFDRHPMEVVRPGSQPPLLMTLRRRLRTLADTGLDLVVALPFDDELRHRSAEEFVDHVLVEPLRARHVVVGANFRFGHAARGDVTTLADLGPSRGFTTEGVTLLELDGEVISSTEIRRALEAGSVERAAEMLGRAHVVDGVVVRGDRRGRGLGFPTANLHVDARSAVPRAGVYAGRFLLADGSGYPCATSVGTNPTFEGTEQRIEAYLIDFDGDLYGVEAAIEFHHRLRDEARFHSVDELVAQMHVDVAEARRLLA